MGQGVDGTRRMKEEGTMLHNYVPLILIFELLKQMGKKGMLEERKCSRMPSRKIRIRSRRGFEVLGLRGFGAEKKKKEEAGDAEMKAS